MPNPQQLPIAMGFLGGRDSNLCFEVEINSFSPLSFALCFTGPLQYPQEHEVSQTVQSINFENGVVVA